MSTEWNLGDFADLVAAKVGDAQLRALTPALQSINEKFTFARYHSTQALDLLRPIKGTPNDDPLSQAAHGMRLLFHQEGSERERFVEALFGARAHAIGFAQSLHSTADYLAKVSYVALDMRARHGIDLAGHQIGFYKIKGRIAGVAELTDIHTAISEYLDAPTFKYLAAFVNTEKHHELVGANFSLRVSVGAVASAGLEIAAFTYDGKNGPESYPKKWAIDFFEKDFESLIASTIAVGVSLTERLKAM